MDINLLLLLLIIGTAAFYFHKLALQKERAPLLMTVLAFVVQAYFVTYSVLAFAIMLAPLLLPVYLLLSAESIAGFAGYLAIIILYVVIAIPLLVDIKDWLLNRNVEGHENPFRKYHSSRGFLNQVTDKFIAWIGTVKYFTSPLSLISDPRSYQVKGEDLRAIVAPTNPDDPTALQPGDILLRGYNGYVDGVMINLTGSSSDLGKYFSHAALYVGEIDQNKTDNIVARRLKVRDLNNLWKEATDTQKNQIRADPDYTRQGKQMVIHSMTRGVFIEDILTFSRCDYLAIIRLKNQDLHCDQTLIDQLNKDNDFKEAVEMYDGREFVKGHDAGIIEEQLLKCESVPRQQAISAIIDSALGKVGSCYDFQFTDIHRAHTFSCSEFVYYCYKGLRYYLGMKPIEHALGGKYFPRKTVTPEDLYKLAQASDNLEIIWVNKVLQDKQSGNAK